MARLAFLFYWFFDNLAVLIKVKFLTRFELKPMARRASKCWLIGIWLSILVALIELYKASNRESQLMLSKANASKDSKQNTLEIADSLKQVRAAKKT